jgi:hypothetical protein
MKPQPQSSDDHIARTITHLRKRIAQLEADIATLQRGNEYLTRTYVNPNPPNARPDQGAAERAGA